MTLSLFPILGALLFSQATPTHRPRTGPDTVGSHPGRPVLIVMPAADSQPLANGRQRATGYFLNEFYEPYRALRANGYTVVFATPGGRRPTVDPESLKRRYWKAHPSQRDEAAQLVDTLSTLAHPLTLEAARDSVHRFAGIIIPGGQGVMVDLLRDSVAHDLLRTIGATGRPVGLVCHAPALLTQLGVANNPFIGRRVTAVSRLEEWYIEHRVMKGAAKDRLIGRALSRAGYRYTRATLPARPFAVRDGNLVTSQNPFSGERFTALYLEALGTNRN